MSENAAGIGFADEEERLHTEVFALIRAGLEEGLGFEDSCARLAVADPELRRVIVDDYLKVTVAERHFRDGRSTAEVANELQIPVTRVNRAREEMIAEVARASVEVFKRQAGDNPPGDST